MSAKFLIEVPHEAAMLPCLRAVDVMQRSGSHWLTHADWGCFDGEHKAWLIVEVDSREAARCIVPPVFRAEAKVVQLNSFTSEEVQGMLRKHDPQAG